MNKSDTLQKLFLEVKLLELQLDYQLLLIYVPSTTMIREGTDGLIRGVIIQHLHKYEENVHFTSSVEGGIAFNTTIDRGSSPIFFLILTKLRFKITPIYFMYHINIF